MLYGVIATFHQFSAKGHTVIASVLNPAKCTVKISAIRFSREHQRSY
jgi:hypothetical protein